MGQLATVARLHEGNVPDVDCIDSSNVLKASSVRESGNFAAQSAKLALFAVDVARVFEASAVCAA